MNTHRRTEKWNTVIPCSLGLVNLCFNVTKLSTYLSPGAFSTQLKIPYTNRKRTYRDDRDIDRLQQLGYISSPSCPDSMGSFAFPYSFALSGTADIKLRINNL